MTAAICPGLTIMLSAVVLESLKGTQQVFFPIKHFVEKGKKSYFLLWSLFSLKIRKGDSKVQFYTVVSELKTRMVSLEALRTRTEVGEWRLTYAPAEKHIGREATKIPIIRTLPILLSESWLQVEVWRNRTKMGCPDGLKDTI